MIRTIGAEDLRREFPMEAAIDALEAAFRTEDPSAAGPPRSSVRTAAGSLLLMPAFGDAGVGVKLVTLTPDNLARYERALSEHLSHLQAFCNRCGIAFCVADTGSGLEHCIFHDLPAAGLIH